MSRFAAALWFFGTLAISTFAAMVALPAYAPAKQARPAPVKEEVAAREVGEPIMTIVSLESQRVTFYDADGWIARAPVSTGIKGRETPAGVFAVIDGRVVFENGRVKRFETEGEAWEFLAPNM